MFVLSSCLRSQVLVNFCTRLNSSSFVVFMMPVLIDILFVLQNRSSAWADDLSSYAVVYVGESACGCGDAVSCCGVVI